MKKSMGISFATYRYAPEQFHNLRVYGMPFPLDADTRQRLGYIHITKGGEACTAAVKRIYRTSTRPKRSLCTIGFSLVGSKSEYCYCRELSARDDNLREKLFIYKEFKRFLVEQDCKYGEYTSATLGADYAPENVETHYREVDITRPVKVYFVEKRR